MPLHTARAHTHTLHTHNRARTQTHAQTLRTPLAQTHTYACTDTHTHVHIDIRTPHAARRQVMSLEREVEALKAKNTTLQASVQNHNASGGFPKPQRFRLACDSSTHHAGVATSRSRNHVTSRSLCNASLLIRRYTSRSLCNGLFPAARISRSALDPAARGGRPVAFGATRTLRPCRTVRPSWPAVSPGMHTQRRVRRRPASEPPSRRPHWSLPLLNTRTRGASEREEGRAKTEAETQSMLRPRRRRSPS